MATLILKLKEREIGTLAISRTVTHIGRDGGCDLVIDNAGISRRHASVRYDGGRWRLRDEESANGLFLHGERIGIADLVEGDAFKLGKFTVVFTTHGGTPESDLVSTGERSVGEKNPVGTLFLDDKDLVRVLRSAGENEDAKRRRTEPEMQAAPATLTVRSGASLGQLVLVALGASVLTGLVFWLLDG